MSIHYHADALTIILVYIFTHMPACFSDLYYYTTMDYEDDPDEADEGGECYAAIQSWRNVVW